MHHWRRSREAFAEHPLDHRRRHESNTRLLRRQICPHTDPRRICQSKHSLHQCVCFFTRMLPVAINPHHRDVQRKHGDQPDAVRKQDSDRSKRLSLLSKKVRILHHKQRQNRLQLRGTRSDHRRVMEPIIGRSTLETSRVEPAILCGVQRHDNSSVANHGLALSRVSKTHTVAAHAGRDQSSPRSANTTLLP